MPCSDVTELMTVTVDDDDRLAHYAFRKRTCGRGIGADSLLLDLFQGQRIDDILAIAPETFLEQHPVEEEVEEFLNLKHLIALQSVLAVLTGAASGSATEICAAAEIAYEPGEVRIEAKISLDLVTERIKACGNCGGCGAKKKERVVFF